MHGRSALSAVRSVGALLALALFQLSALAFDPYPNFQFFPGPGGVSGQVVGGAAADWGAAGRVASSSGVTASLTRGVPFVPPTSGTFRMLFTPANIAKGLATGATVGVSLAVAPTISALLNAACVRAFGGAMTLSPGGQWEECHFTNQTVSQWAGKNNVGSVIGPWRNSYQEAAKDVEDWYNLNNSGVCSPKAVFTLGTVTSTTWSITKTCGGVSTYDWYRGGYATQNATQQVQDGWISATPARAETLITNQLQLWTSGDDAAKAKILQALDEAYAAGQKIDGTVQAPTLTSVNEPDINVVKSDPATGTTTTDTTKVKNDYSCTVISNGQALSCTQYQTSTTTSTTVKPDPSNPSTTTTTTITTTNTATLDPQKQDGDQCAKYPDSLGCSKFGTPVAGDTLAKDTKNVTITPATFAGGSCPAPINFSAFGHGYTFAYDTMCAKLALVGNLLLALSGLLAAYIFADGFRV